MPARRLRHAVLGGRAACARPAGKLKGKAGVGLGASRPVKALLLVFLVSLLSTAAAETKPRIALVIGNGSYKETPLRNPLNDAQDIGRALRTLGFDVRLHQDLNQQEMDKAIAEFGQSLSKGAVGLFYFAGHGVQVQGRNYLVPIDAGIQRESQVKYRAVDMGMIMEEMHYAGSEINVVILDACRNNPFARSFRSLNRGLAIVDSPQGSLIAYATAPGATAADGEGRNGLFTKHLLASIQKRGLDIEQAFKQVRIEVGKETHGDQIPWVSTSLLDKFCFAGCDVEPPSVGHLQIRVNVPDSKVYFDGKFAGFASPDRSLESDLPIGPLEVRVKAEGYQSQTQQEEIRSQWRTALKFDLMPIPRPKMNAIDELVSKARGAIEVDALTTPPGDNAVAYAEKILGLDPKNPEAQRILQHVVDRYVVLAKVGVSKKDIEAAQIYQERARAVARKHDLTNASLGELAVLIDSLTRPKPRPKPTPLKSFTPATPEPSHELKPIVTKPPPQDPIKGDDKPQWVPPPIAF
jgi:hypothetical protein